jgi:hypothetical protein
MSSREELEIPSPMSALPSMENDSAMTEINPLGRNTSAREGEVTGKREITRDGIHQTQMTE